MQLLSLDNYKQLEPWVHKANWKEYNSNIITMLMWNDSFPIYFQIYDHFALVCFLGKHGKSWFMPYCEKAYLKQATDTLLSLSQKDRKTLMIHSITQEYKDFLDSTYVNLVYFEHHEVAEDYVYDRFQQETLSGKKMQKRRNHYNYFLKEYQNRYTYHSLSKEDIPHIYELLEVWKKNKVDVDPSTIDIEEEGIHFLLEQFDQLNIQGICIYIDNVLEAFSIASLISDDMVQIHIEKANKNIRGLYVVILKHMLETLPSTVQYVNREDDMGLAYLRKAKHDMRPIFKIKKYLAVFDFIQITHPHTKEEFSQMYNIWQSRFQDENIDTTKFFFEQHLKKENAYILSNSHEVMGMAYVNPWKMMIHQQVTEVGFMEGIAIDEDYEGCGLMKKLVNHILSASPYTVMALQAYHWDLYKPFGFEVTHYLQKGYIDTNQYTHFEGHIELCQNSKLLQSLYTSFTKKKDGYRIRDIDYYSNYFIPYQEVCKYQILLYSNMNEQGYLVYHKQDDTLFIEEIIYENQSALNHMLSWASSKSNKVHIVIDSQANVYGTFNQTNALMMNKPYKQEVAFLNEVL